MNHTPLPLDDPPTPRPWRAWAILLAFLTLFLGAYLTRWPPSLWKLLTDRVYLQDVVASWGAWGPLLTISLHILQVLLAPIPGQLIDTVNGYLFGPWLGTLYSLTGIAIGSGLALLIARRWGRKLVTQLIPPAPMERIDRLASQRGPLFFFLLFLLPFVPDDIVCFVAGLSPIPLGWLWFLATVGRLPGLLAANLIGAFVHLSPWQWIVIGALIFALAGLFWREQRHLESLILRLAHRLSSPSTRTQKKDNG